MCTYECFFVTVRAGMAYRHRFPPKICFLRFYVYGPTVNSPHYLCSAYVYQPPLIVLNVLSVNVFLMHLFVHFKWILTIAIWTACCQYEHIVCIIGIIYGCMRAGYRYPHFLDWGVQYPHFSGRKDEEFAVIWGNLRRLNYNKNIFGRGSAPDPAGRAHNALPDPRVDEEECFLPILLPFRLGT